MVKVSISRVIDRIPDTLVYTIVFWSFSIRDKRYLCPGLIFLTLTNVQKLLSDSYVPWHL